MSKLPTILWWAIVVMALIIWHQRDLLATKQQRISALQQVVDTYQDDAPEVSCTSWRTR